MLSNYETGCTIQKYWTHLIVLVILPHVLFSSVLPYRSTEPTWLFLYFYPMYSVLVYFFTEVQNPLDCSCTSTSCTLFWCTYFTEVQNPPDCSCSSNSCTLFCCTTRQKYKTSLIVPVFPPYVLCSGVLTLQKYRTNLIVLVLLPHVLFSGVLLSRSTEPTWLFLYFHRMYYSVLVYYYAEV